MALQVATSEAHGAHNHSIAVQGLCDSVTEDSTFTMPVRAAPPPPKQEPGGGAQEVPVLAQQCSTATALSR